MLERIGTAKIRHQGLLSELARLGSRASVITYINPAVAALLGVCVLHESLGFGGMLAFVLILLGSWLATRGAAP
jgi:drug/metabolite transporter (DMT)-like permease